MVLKPLLISLGLILVLSSCSFLQKERVVTKTVFVEKAIEIKPRPNETELSDVQWYVANEENLGEFIGKFKGENGELAFVALSIRGYEILAKNIEEIRRYLLQQAALLDYYERSIEEKVELPTEETQ